MAKRKKQKKARKLQKPIAKDKKQKNKKAEKQTELEKIKKEIRGIRKLLKKIGGIFRKIWSFWKKVKGRGYWIRGIIWGWAFFIIGFFVFVFVSDALVFVLLFPGWMISSLLNGKGFTFETHFGPLLISVILFSFLFYCVAGALAGLGIEKIKHRDWSKKSKKSEKDKKKSLKAGKSRKKSKTKKVLRFR